MKCTGDFALSRLWLGSSPEEIQCNKIGKENIRKSLVHQEEGWGAGGLSEVPEEAGIVATCSHILCYG